MVKVNAPLPEKLISILVLDLYVSVRKFLLNLPKFLKALLIFLNEDVVFELWLNLQCPADASFLIFLDSFKKFREHSLRQIWDREGASTSESIHISRVEICSLWITSKDRRISTQILLQKFQLLLCPRSTKQLLLRPFRHLFAN